MARYLITGGAGFIGSHLAEMLVADGHHVRVLDDFSNGKSENLVCGIDVLTADVTDEGSVSRAFTNVDGCFHLAAVASVECAPNEWVRKHDINLAGTITVFSAALRAQRSLGRVVPVVYASSAAVYGEPSAVPIQEGATLHPNSAYGVDKLGCELHAAVAAHLYDLRAVGLRFFNVYGPRQDPRSPYSGVVSKFCRQTLRGLPIEIHGDGSQVRDFVYVEDAVDALRQAMARVSRDPQIYNVCTGVGTSIWQLGATIARMRGVAFSPGYAEARAGDIQASIGSPHKARDRLEFSAVTSLEEGLARTLEAMSMGTPCVA